MTSTPVDVGCCELDPHVLFFTCPACGDPQSYDTTEWSESSIACDCCGAPLELRAHLRTDVEEWRDGE